MTCTHKEGLCSTLNLIVNKKISKDSSSRQQGIQQAHISQTHQLNQVKAQKWVRRGQNSSHLLYRLSRYYGNGHPDRSRVDHHRFGCQLRKGTCQSTKTILNPHCHLKGWCWRIYLWSFKASQISSVYLVSNQLIVLVKCLWLSYYSVN